MEVDAPKETPSLIFTDYELPADLVVRRKCKALFDEGLRISNDPLNVSSKDWERNMLIWPDIPFEFIAYVMYTVAQAGITKRQKEIDDYKLLQAAVDAERRITAEAEAAKKLAEDSTVA